MNKKRLSAIGSLRELVVILSGITITFALARIVDGMNSAARINIQAVTLFVLLTLSIVRFYHGNMRLLDDSYDAENQTKAGRNIVVDFAVILFTSLVFAAMGAFIQDYMFFFASFTAILALDAIWGLYAMGAHNIEALPIQKHWVGNNAICTFALLIVYIVRDQAQLSVPVIFSAMVVCALASTIYDYVVSWRFYFPAVGA